MSELIDREAVRELIKSYRHSTDVAFDMEKHLDEIPAAPRWHRMEEPPPQSRRCKRSCRSGASGKLQDLMLQCLVFTIARFVAERGQALKITTALTAGRRWRCRND